VSVRRLLMPLTLTAMAALCVEAAAQGAFPAPLPNQSSSSSQSGSSSSPFPPVNQSGSSNAAPAASSPFPPVNGGAASQQRPASASPFPSTGGAAASQGVFSQGSAPLGGGLAAGAYNGGAQGGGSASAAEQQECMEKFVPLRQDAEKRAQAIKAASDRKAAPKEACSLITSYVQAEAKLVNYVTTKQTACGIPAEIPKQLKANQAKSQQMMKAVCQAASQPQGGAGAPPSLSETLGSSSAPEIRRVRGGGSTFDTLNGNVLGR
jgi:hypothetical protein